MGFNQLVFRVFPDLCDQTEMDISSVWSGGASDSQEVETPHNTGQGLLLHDSLPLSAVFLPLIFFVFVLAKCQKE